MKTFSEFMIENGMCLDESGMWIASAEKDIEKRHTKGVCTGDKFGGPTCPPGSKRYALAKTFKKLGKHKK